MKKLKKKGILDSGIESDFSYVDELGTAANEVVPAADPVVATPSIVSPAATLPLSSLVMAELGSFTDQSLSATIVYAQLAPTTALINPTTNPAASPNGDQPVTSIDAVVYIEMFSNDPKYTDSLSASDFYVI